MFTPLFAKTTSVFTRQNEESENNTRVSYIVSNLIAQHMKPFSDGEFVKDCLMSVVDVLIPEKRGLFSNISLSRRTVTRRIEELSEDLKISLRTLAGKFELYSLAVDESTMHCNFYVVRLKPASIVLTA